MSATVNSPAEEAPAPFRFSLTRLANGLYAQVSDDQQQAWLVYRYTEEGDAVDGNDQPILGTFWGAARIPDRYLRRDSECRIVGVAPNAHEMEYRLDAYTDNHLRRRDVLTYLAGRQHRPNPTETR